MIKYEAIIDYIKNKISLGEIKAGEKLPSIRELSDKFLCSKVTVVRAYDMLEKEHIVYSIPKSGHYLIESDLNLSNNTFDGKIDFSAAAPDSSILPYDDFQHCINQAMNLYKDKLFYYSNVQGFESLIESVVKQLQDYQVFTDKQQVFITTGSQQAINILTMMGFPNGKENVLVEQPTYHGVINSLQLNNIKTIGIRRNYNGIDYNELERIFKYENIKFFYIIPRFHNPTGFSYSNKEKKNILKLCEKYDVYVVEDDYLADLEVDRKSDPIYALDSSSRVIYLKSYSKILIPGLRISAVVLPKILTETFKEYKKWNDLNTSMLSQGALEIYIKSGMFNEHVKNLRRIYFERMGYLNNLIRDFQDSNVKWYIPSSGFFACLEIANRVNSKDIIKRLSMKKILLEDTSQFYLKNHVDNKFLRLSISRVSNEEINRGITIIIKEINEGLKVFYD